MFVANDIFECVAYRVCRSAENLVTNILCNYCITICQNIFFCDKTELLFNRNQTIHNICGYLFCPCISIYRYNSWPGPSLLPPASWEDLSLFSFYREMILCMQEKGEREIEYIFPQLSSFKLYHWARQHTTYIYPSCIVLPGIFRYFIY